MFLPKVKKQVKLQQIFFKKTKKMEKKLLHKKKLLVVTIKKWTNSIYTNMENVKGRVVQALIT